MKKSMLVRILLIIAALPGFIWLMISMFTWGEVEFGLDGLWVAYAVMCPFVLMYAFGSKSFAERFDKP